MVLEIVFNALDVIFSPIMGFNPIYSIFIIATIIAFVITLANKLLVDQDRLEYLRKEMQDFQQQMMQARKSNDPKALEKVQKNQAKFMDLSRFQP